MNEMQNNTQQPDVTAPQMQPVVESPAMQKQGKSAMAIAGIVVGIVALVTAWMPIVNNASFFIAIIGAILAIVGIIGTGAGKKSGRALAIAGLVISIVAGAVVLGTQAMYSAAIDSAAESASKSLDKMTGDATDEILGTEVDVAIGELEMTTDTYGIVDTKLPVTVTNLLDESKSYTVQIEAVDASGSRIDTSSVYANNLGAGQSQTFDAFTFVTSDTAKKLEGATFDVVEVSQF